MGDEMGCSLNFPQEFVGLVGEKGLQEFGGLMGEEVACVFGTKLGLKFFLRKIKDPMDYKK